MTFRVTSSNFVNRRFYRTTLDFAERKFDKKGLLFLWFYHYMTIKQRLELPALDVRTPHDSRAA